MLMYFALTIVFREAFCFQNILYYVNYYGHREQNCVLFNSVAIIKFMLNSKLTGLRILLKHKSKIKVPTRKFENISFFHSVDGEFTTKLNINVFFQEWGPSCPHEYLGSYKLEHDQSWTPLKDIDKRASEIALVDKILNHQLALTDSESILRVPSKDYAGIKVQEVASDNGINLDQS